MSTRAILSVLAIAAITSVSHAAWNSAHGDSANTGFVKIDTVPASAPAQIAEVGELGSGAGPVVGPDGTVYVGNLYGQVLAFHANGTPAWSRQVPSGQWISSSPVVGSDGSVYVVSETRYQDRAQVFHYESTLHKFTPDGGWLWQAPFPQREGSRGDAYTPPNIWRRNGDEAVIVPVLYPLPAGTALRLMAFSTGGAVLGDTLVSQRQPGTVTSSWD
jgi:hypothetical protein